VIDRWRAWISRADKAAGGLATDLGLYALSTLFALVTAASSTLGPHRNWGTIAVFGYAAATLCVLVLLLARWPHRRGLLTALTWLAVAIVPLLVEAARGEAQEEVIVVERAGQRLLDTGTPYLGRAAIAALPADERLLGYVPYQPGMALFGLPRTLAGTHWWTDARVWFALVTAAVLAAALAVVRAHASGTALVRALQAATVLPICALTLAVGGDDLPVLALCLLALAFAARERFVGAGLAVGVAGALKLFAWPVALVLLALAATRGRRVAARFALPAIGLPILAVLPALAVDPSAAVENLVRFPLGRGLVGSPAASPFPGHLIAEALPGGRLIAAVLLVAAGLAIGWWLLRRPPRDAATAALICAYGLTAALLLMPATRFGYLLYPIAYLVWHPVFRWGSRPAPTRRTQGE
jgi:Glycosyltransferase family 87